MDFQTDAKSFQSHSINVQARSIILEHLYFIVPYEEFFFYFMNCFRGFSLHKTTKKSCEVEFSILPLLMQMRRMSRKCFTLVAFIWSSIHSDPSSNPSVQKSFKFRTFFWRSQYSVLISNSGMAVPNDDPSNCFVRSSIYGTVVAKGGLEVLSI